MGITQNSERISHRYDEHASLHYTTPHYTIPHYTIPHYTIPHYTTLHCTVSIYIHTLHRFRPIFFLSADNFIHYPSFILPLPICDQTISSTSISLLPLHLHVWTSGVAIDRTGNAFAVGSGNIGNVARNSTVFYSPLSSAYSTWSSISPPGKFRVETSAITRKIVLFY